MQPVNNNRKILNLVVEKSLLGISVACAVLSVIPPFRLVGNISLRVIALAMGGKNLSASWSQSTSTEKVILCAKVVLATAGIIGVATQSPAILTAALIADMAINIFEGIKAGMNGNIAECSKHFMFFQIEALILVGIAIGSAPIFMQAAIITASVMTTFALYSAYKAYKTGEYHNLFDAMAYGILAATSAINFTQLKAYSNARPTTTVSGKNESNKILQIYDKDGNQLATVRPGESYNLALKGDVDCLYYKAIPVNGRIPEAGMWEFKSGNALFAEALKIEGFTSPGPGTGLEVPTKFGRQPTYHAI